MTITTGPRLSDETATIGRDCPGWHAWTSSAGRTWAATTENHAGGSGTTLDAPTPEAMRREIAIQERIWRGEEPWPCWANPLTRAERAALRKMLSRWCLAFFAAGYPAASGEMGDLHLDVTERAEVAAA